MKSQIITEKLEELIALAKIEGENSTAIVLNTLAGARKNNDERLLALNTQEFIRAVLMPRAEAREIINKAVKN